MILTVTLDFIFASFVAGAATGIVFCLCCVYMLRK